MFLSEVKSFLLHLRLHYQLFILSGAYLLGAVLSHFFDPSLFFLQFLNVHVLLFGGVTAYNSYHDKDTTPIGGLKHPPQMASWMLFGSWILQIAGLIIGIVSGTFFLFWYLLSMLSFWLYSSPVTRWKGNPVLSLLAIGVSTGVCSFFLGLFSSGVQALEPLHIASALGVSFLILSLFPLSQAYQMREDKKRRDTTFCVAFGLQGVKLLYLLLYPLGILLVSYGLSSRSVFSAVIFLFLGIVTGTVSFFEIRTLRGIRKEYSKIMSIKYLSGSLFSLFLIFILFFF